MDPWRNLFLLPTHSKRGLSYLPDPFCFNWTISNRKRGRTLFFFPEIYRIDFIFFSPLDRLLHSHCTIYFFIILRLLCHLYVCFFFFLFLLCLVLCATARLLFQKNSFGWEIFEGWRFPFPFCSTIHAGQYSSLKKVVHHLVFFFFPTIKSSSSSSSSFPDFPNQFLTAIWLISFLESSSWCVVYFL